MAIKTDKELLDGSYGTTQPIKEGNEITAERHRDIVESKVSRADFFKIVGLNSTPGDAKFDSVTITAADGTEVVSANDVPFFLNGAPSVEDSYGFSNSYFVKETDTFPSSPGVDIYTTTGVLAKDGEATAINAIVTGTISVLVLDTQIAAVVTNLTGATSTVNDIDVTVQGGRGYQEDFTMYSDAECTNVIKADDGTDLTVEFLVLYQQKETWFYFIRMDIYKGTEDLGIKEFYVKTSELIDKKIMVDFQGNAIGHNPSIIGGAISSSIGQFEMTPGAYYFEGSIDNSNYKFELIQSSTDSAPATTKGSYTIPDNDYVSGTMNWTFTRHSADYSDIEIFGTLTSIKTGLMNDFVLPASALPDEFTRLNGQRYEITCGVLNNESTDQAMFEITTDGVKLVKNNVPATGQVTFDKSYKLAVIAE